MVCICVHGISPLQHQCVEVVWLTEPQQKYALKSTSRLSLSGKLCYFTIPKITRSQWHVWLENILRQHGDEVINLFYEFIKKMSALMFFGGWWYGVCFNLLFFLPNILLSGLHTTVCVPGSLNNKQKRSVLKYLKETKCWGILKGGFVWLVEMKIFVWRSKTIWYYGGIFEFWLAL